MSTQVKRRRGTAAENAAFTGAEGEIIAITDDERLALHDASAAGGVLFLNDTDIFNNAEKYALAGGTANALTTTITGKSLTNGCAFFVKASATNTGAATLNHNGAGAVNILKSDPTSGTLASLEANDIVTGGLYLIGHNGSNPILMNAGASSADAASTAEIAAESAVDKYMRPDRARYMPGAAKAWVMATSSTTISDSFNVSSISTPSGRLRVNFTTAMPDANYCVLWHRSVTQGTSGNDWFTVNSSTRTTTYVESNNSPVSGDSHVVIYSTW